MRHPLVCLGRLELQADAKAEAKVVVLLAVPVVTPCDFILSSLSMCFTTTTENR